MIALYVIRKRSQPELEWSVDTLETLFIDLLAANKIKPRVPESQSTKAPQTAAPSPAPRKLLREADAVAMGNYVAIEHPEHPVRRARHDSEAHQQRIDANRKIALHLIDPLPAASFEATLKANPVLAEALSDEGYAGTFNPDAITIVHVQSEAKHGGGNFLSANAIAQSQVTARAEARRSKAEFERGRAIGSASNAGGGMTWNNERKAL